MSRFRASNVLVREYDGLTYRRYPDAVHYADRKYYRNWTGAVTGSLYLHNQIWSAAYGPVPDGFRVMFLDGDSENLALENLVLRSAKAGRPKKDHPWIGHKRAGIAESEAKKRNMK